jgi:C-terminal peptidase prc
MTRRTSVLWLLATAVVLGLAACSGVQQTRKPNVPEPPVPPPPPEEEAACKEFLAAADRASDMHLTHERSQRGRILAESYRWLIDGEKARAVKNADSELVGDLDRLKQAVGTSVDSCAPYRAIAPLFAKEGKRTNTDPLVLALHWGLWGFLDRLDMFTGYLPPKNLEETAEDAAYGAGIVFHQRTDYLVGRPEGLAPDYLVVKDVVSGSPNRNLFEDPEGLPRNTQVLAIETEDDGNGAPTAVKRLGYRDAVRAINDRQPPPSNAPDDLKSIWLHVRRDKEEKPERIRVQLETYRESAAWMEPIGQSSQGLRRIVLSSFPDKADLMLSRNSLDNVLQEEPSIQGVILDFRGNGGGSIDEAILIAEDWLPARQVICHAVDKAGDRESVRTLRDPIRFPNTPAMVVLVDARSASASEIVTSALQLNRRALVVGERTVGKGLAQKVERVGKALGGAMYVVVAHIFAPDGTSWQARGIEPDILVDGGDPVLQERMAAYAQEARNDPFKTPLQAREGALNGRVIPAPEPLNDVKFTPPSGPVTEEIRATLRALRPATPPSCLHKPGDPEFREEDDCLLDWAAIYLKELVRLQRATPAAD